MKKLVSDAGGYKTYMEIKPFEIKSHVGWVNLRVTTVWEGARGEVHEQVKFDLNLDPDGLVNFKGLLNEM